MAAEFTSSGKSSWPPADAASSYRPSLFVAMAASAGLVVGSFGTWANVLLFTVGGLDFQNWGKATLILGVASAFAVLTVAFWSRTPFNPRWAVPLAWLIALVGVACLTDAVINIVRLMTVPKGNIFGVPIGVSSGWGLWLVALSCVITAVAGAILATQIGRADDLQQDLAESTTSWTDGWRRAAVAVAAIIVLAGAVYGVTNTWKNDADSSASFRTALPSFPNFPSFPVSTTSSAASSVTTSAQPTLPPVVQAPPLDGTYRQDFDEASITTDGRMDPGSDADPRWFAFRSLCTEAGCVASGDYLDPHKLGLPLQHSSAGLILHWIGDHWEYSDTYKSDCSGPNGDAQQEISNVWQFTHQPDGFFSGTATRTTLSDECGNEGATRVEPFTLTRTAPPPPGTIRPSVDLASQAPAPPPSAHRSPPEPSATVILGGQELRTGSKLPLCSWKNGKGDLIVESPNGGDDSVAQVTDLSGNHVGGYVDISVNDLLYRFDDWTRTNISPEVNASVVRKGRKSYTVTGIAAAWNKPTGSYLLQSYEIDVTCP
jgi:hypothetical protein